MGCIYQRGGTWWIKYYRHGKPLYESAGSASQADARKLLRQREGDVERGLPVVPKMGRVTFEEAMADLVNDYRVNGRRSLPELERRIRKHLTPFFATKRMATITASDVREYVNGRKEAGAANANVNRELAALKRAFSLAIQAGKLAVRPHIPMLQEDNVRTGFFEEEQFNAVRARLPEPLRRLMTFAFLTGWRVRSEILPLKWKDVDIRHGVVTLPPGSTKNKKGRVFPFTKELRSLLEAQREYTRGVERANGIVVPFVFHRNGRPIRDFYTAWRNACAAAGVPARVPHDFRRTAVRGLVRAGIPERVAMQMTGHLTRSIFDRYHIVSEGDLQEAARRLDVARKVL